MSTSPAGSHVVLDRWRGRILTANVSPDYGTRVSAEGGSVGPLLADPLNKPPCRLVAARGKLEA